uniref:Uncharacterized protein n=1 Tax=Papio anubis TaxID=9555 RepID=A0A8I5NMA7_PAPAN
MYGCYFPNSLCSLCVSVSHFENSPNISSFLLITILFCVCVTKFPSCCPGWSAMAQSQLTATSTSQFRQFYCLSLPGSSNSPSSASQVAGTTVTSHQSWLFLFYFLLFLFLFLVETGFHRVSQVGLELLTSCDLPTLASQSAGIAGVSHCAWTSFFFFFFWVICTTSLSNLPSQKRPAVLTEPIESLLIFHL